MPPRTPPRPPSPWPRARGSPRPVAGRGRGRASSPAAPARPSAGPAARSGGGSRLARPRSGRGRRAGRPDHLPDPRHPRLSQAGNRIQGHHPAAGRWPGTPGGGDRACQLGSGFVPVRKQGRLPGPTYAQSYELEYGTATVEVHRDAFRPGERVLIVDDVLATGGTARATASLVRRAGADIVGIAVIMELTFLGGRAKLAGEPLRTLVAV